MLRWMVVNVPTPIGIPLMARCPEWISEEALNAWDHWITDRIPLNAVAPATGNSWDSWITDRIPLNVWVGV